MNAFEKIVDDYISDYQRDAEEEQGWFAQQGSLRKAVETAALAMTREGKRFSHQRLNPARALEASKKRLLDCLTELKKSHSFEELYDVVNRAIRDIDGIGELAVYDTALRIGAFLHLEPGKVYLHRGTRDGARHLGLDVSREFIEISELPVEFRVLKPREIEDVLCIYKHHFLDEGIASKVEKKKSRGTTC